MLKLVFFSFLLTFAAPQELYEKPCKADDRQCLTALANSILKKVLNGYQPFKLPSLNPFELQIVETNRPDFYFKMAPVKAYGFDNCVFEDAYFDLNKKTVRVQSSFKTITMKGPYKLKGSFTGNNVDGEGEAVLSGSNLTLTYNAKYDLEIRDGEPYARIVDSKTDYKIKDAHAVFGNIVKGDKIKSMKLNDELNKYPLIMAHLLGSDLVKVFNAAYDTVLAKLFERKPLALLAY